MSHLRFFRLFLLTVGMGVVTAPAVNAETLTIPTEGEPVVIEINDIPMMYALPSVEDSLTKGAAWKPNDSVVNPDYLRFLEQRIFPKGIPKEPVEPARQPFLFRYCVASYEMKNYSQALDCLQAVRLSVQKHGDPPGLPYKSTPIQLYPIGFVVNKPGGEYPLAVKVPMLHSEILFDLGDIPGAVKLADEALAGKAAIPLKNLPRPYHERPEQVLARTICRDDYSVQTLWKLSNSCGFGGNGNLSTRIHLASLYGVVGQREKSDRYLKEIKEEMAGLEGSFDKFYRTKRRLALVQIYLARKEYETALTLADDESSTGQDIFYLAVGLASIATGGGMATSLLFAPAIDQHTVSTKFQVAHARVEVGRLGEAKPYLDEILAKDSIKALPGIYWAALYDRGRIAESEGQTDEAIGLYQRAVDEIERQRSTIQTENAKIGFFGDKQAVYQALIRLLFKSGRHEEAFLMGERSKSRALVDMLAGKQDFRIAGPAAEQVRQLLAQSQVSEVALQRDTAPDREIAARTKRKFDEQGEVKAADIAAVAAEVRSLKSEAREALTRQAPELASLVSVPQVGLADIRAALPADEALLSYYYDAGNLYAFLIDGSNFQAMQLERAGLEAEVEAFRDAIENRRDSHQALGRALHARLIAPLLPHLRKSRLDIAGHGKLHYLPFAALHDGKDYLLDRYQLASLPSAATLKFIDKQRGAGKTGVLLALGNPDLGDRQYDLPFAEKEARQVAALFPRSAVLVQKEANKQNLQNVAADFSYLHFATHGKFDADDPLGSALLLAGEATRPADRLTVGELYGMNIDAELVTLSACETGLGKVANGDDVVGLVRGFLYAGAGRVVSTLWPIEDEATAQLMTAFYGQLKVGKPKAEALRAAQTALRAKYPHPFFWAAFQITAGR